MGKENELSPPQNEHFDYTVEVSPDGLEAYLTMQHRSRDRIDVREEPNWPSPDEIIDVLHEHNVKHGLEMDVIHSMSRGELNGKQRVARGTPPVPGQDGWVECLFAGNEPKVDLGDLSRVDYFERDEVTRVQSGTVIAQIHPPTEGCPGRTVSGEVIQLPPPKSARITILEGATLDADKGHVIATRDGRPVYTDEAIWVIDLLEIKGNVNLKSGNVRYKGAVVVNGDVEENLLVDAQGAVLVRGNVAQARVHSQTAIRVDGQVVGSGLVVNAMTDFAEQMCNAAEIAFDRLSSLYTVAEELLRRLPRQGKTPSIGQFVIFLSARKFPEISTRIQELGRLLRDDFLNASIDRNDALQTVDQLTKGQLEQLETLTDLQHRVSRLGDLVKRLRTSAEQRGYFVGRYSQVSKIVVSGSAYFQGRGAYHTQVEAGRFVVVNGIFRGGMAKAKKGVYIREAGSPVGVETVVRLEDGGVLRASIIHPGVHVHIGARVWRATSQWQNVEVRVSKSGTIEAVPIRSWTPPTPPQTL